MRVTVEDVIDAATTEVFLDLYRSAFAPIEHLAAGRQSLTDEEFREEMGEPSVKKIVGWNRRDEAVAMVVIATNLSVVPWISPAFWRHRYPDHYERGLIHYYGALLVSPAVQGGPWAARILGEAIRYTAAIHGIAAFDCCEYNVAEIKLPELIASIGDRLCEFEAVEVDVQRYYAYVSHGLKPDVIDLREPVSTGVPERDGV